MTHSLFVGILLITLARALMIVIKLDFLHYLRVLTLLQSFNFKSLLILHRDISYIWNILCIFAKKVELFKQIQL